jgi:methyl halide transferase
MFPKVTNVTEPPYLNTYFYGDKTNTVMTETFWNNRYLTSKTEWDLKQVSPPLKSFMDGLDNKNLKILIPGCGNAYEAEYLLNKGFHQVTLVDISTVLIEKLRQKFAGQPIQIIHGDFFHLDESYDLILEQTFFCAIDLALRPDYVKQAYKLLKPGGRIAGLLFNTDFNRQGPPFGGNRAEYEKLFKPYFDLMQLSNSKNSVLPRFGRELFFEFSKANS